MTISRTGVYGIAIREQKILLVRQQRGPHAGKWELPGGGIEPGETVEGALRREWLEEVGMSFATMQLFENVTALTDSFDEKGNPYSLHQIGLVYLVFGLSPSDLNKDTMPHAWVDFKELKPESVSPFVRHFVWRHQ